MLEKNKIYHEDCLIGMEKIDDQSVDLIVCDLPYGTTACAWDTIISFDKLWPHYLRIAKKDCPIVLFGAEPFSTLLRMSNLKHYKYDWYWLKNAPTGFVFAKKQPMRDIETISVFCQGSSLYQPQGVYRLKQPTYVSDQKTPDIYRDGSLTNSYVQEFSGYPNNVIRIQNKKKGNFHPTQKPVALLEYLIKTYSKPGDLVLDNCMGSGTTAVACQNTDRNFIGFELDPDYYEKAIERLENNTTQLELDL